MFSLEMVIYWLEFVLWFNLISYVFLGKVNGKYLENYSNDYYKFFESFRNKFRLCV